MLWETDAFIINPEIECYILPHECISVACVCMCMCVHVCMLKNCTDPITQCIHVCEPTRGHACSCTQCELTFVWAKKTDVTTSKGHIAEWERYKNDKLNNGRKALLYIYIDLFEHLYTSKYSVHRCSQCAQVFTLYIQFCTIWYK